MNVCKGGVIMRDTIETIGKGSIIQHGEHNDRIYVMKVDEQDIDIIVEEIKKIANKNTYSKIICKVPKKMAPLFLADGYLLESVIPLFYNNQEDVFFMSKFLNKDRLLDLEKKQLQGLSGLLTKKPKRKTNLKTQTEGYTVRQLNTSDVEKITAIYKVVFETYPFPIHNANYILKTMQEDVQYFGVEMDDKLVALSSAEIDFSGGNAEMTDFATHPTHTGNNLSVLLLTAMETEMQKQGIKCLYTIARTNSTPMNKTFLRFDYQYSGTLKKNTNIAGKIESMNIYYKHI